MEAARSRRLPLSPKGPSARTVDASLTEFLASPTEDDYRRYAANIEPAPSSVSGVAVELHLNLPPYAQR